MTAGSAQRGDGSPRTDLSPETILEQLQALDRHLRVEAYYSERSLFYNPGGTAPLGVIFASLKDRDGPNDRSSNLSRVGVYRFAFQMAVDRYRDLFGPPPPRPPKGGVVAYPFDPAEIGRVLPHPVYAWMRWVQILAPAAETFRTLQPALEESLDGVRARWRRRQAAR